MFSRRDFMKGSAAAGTLAAANAARPTEQDDEEMIEARVVTTRFEREYGRKPRAGLVRTWHFELLRADGSPACNGYQISLHKPYRIALAMMQCNAWDFGADIIDVGP